MFSKFKGFLRRVGARAKEHLYDAIGEGLRDVTDQNILGWFQHAGLLHNPNVIRCRIIGTYGSSRIVS